MTKYTDSSDLHTFVGGIFEKAYRDPELGPKLSATGAVLMVECTDPESTVVLDMPNQKVYATPQEAPVPPNATLRMDTDTANRFWQGKVNMTLAMAKGQVKADGAIMKVLKLVPNTKFLYPIYIQDLKDAGRQDLLA